MKLTLDFFQKLQKGLEYKKLELIKDCSVALQAFVGEPKKAIKQKIQAMNKIQAVGVGVSSDFAFVTTDNFNVTLESDNFDMGWEQAF